MDFGIAGKSLLIVGDAARIIDACTTALASEGVQALAPSDDPRRSDIVIAALSPGASVDIALLDAEAGLLIEEWERLAALCDTIRTAIGGMVERGFGRIIFVGPVAAKILVPDALADRIVGLGALGLQKNLGGEYGESGITANSVLYDDATEQAALLQGVGATCAYLASRQAAYLTGTVMSVDGGKAGSLF